MAITADQRKGKLTIGTTNNKIIDNISISIKVFLEKYNAPVLIISGNTAYITKNNSDENAKYELVFLNAADEIVKTENITNYH